MPEFSMIIPCYRDEERLSSLLEQLCNLSNNEHEIIVVDGAASKICRNLCRTFQVRWLPSQPCRGQQLKEGASAAKGNVLWFLHADVRLSLHSFSAITQAVENGASGGYFKFRFDSPRNWQADILEPIIALRCRIGVPYGDQGLFFLRECYHTVGGHAPWPLFEEVPLVRKARRYGKFIALNKPIFVNSRRWQQEGWWQRTWRNRVLALQFFFFFSPQRLATRYSNKTPNQQSRIEY